DSLVSSTVLCAGKFEMAGSGHFVSGHVSAKEGALVSVIGIPVGTKARLTVGTDMLAQTRVGEIEAEIEAAEKRAEKIIEIERQMGPNTSNYSTLSTHKRAEIDRLLELLGEIQKSVLASQNERAALLQRPKRNYDAAVQVRRRAHEDAIIEFPLGRLVVRPAVSAVRFAYESEADRVALLPLAA
ncbi:MAG: FapA family protein, partial [Candidatus Eisenbacteria bacterium]